MILGYLDKYVAQIKCWTKSLCAGGAGQTRTYPADTRESDPSTAPPSNSTAMMVVCRMRALVHLSLIPNVSEAATTFKSVVNPKMPPTHPCRHLLGHQFWPRFFQHCDARLRSGTNQSNCGDTSSKTKPLLPTLTWVSSVRFLKAPGFIKSVRQKANQADRRHFPSAKPKVKLPLLATNPELRSVAT